MSQRTVTYPHQPDTGVRALCPETLRRNTGGVGDGVITAVHIYGDDLPVVIGFDLRSDVPFVYILAQSGDLISGASWRIHFDDLL